MPNKQSLILAIDIGNSAATYGLCSGRQIKRSGYVLSDDIPKISLKIIKSGISRHNYKVIISSVVPQITLKLSKSIKRVFGSKVPLHILGKNLKISVSTRYSQRALGADRLANVYGALRRYKPPILVIDYGTAITFDYISKRGIFEGGLIIPGLNLSARALGEHTALLPSLKKLGPVRGLCGRNTKEAINAGVLIGFAALSDGLVERFQKFCRPRRLTVLATGGLAKKVAPYVRHFDYVDPMHTIRSLALIYRNEIEKTNVR